MIAEIEMSEILTIADNLGPEKIIQIYDPATNLQAAVVIDNVAAGPAIGGTRVPVRVQLIRQPPCRPPSEPIVNEGNRVCEPTCSAAR